MRKKHNLKRVEGWLPLPVVKENQIFQAASDISGHNPMSDAQQDITIESPEQPKRLKLYGKTLKRIFAAVKEGDVRSFNSIIEPVTRYDGQIIYPNKNPNKTSEPWLSRDISSIGEVIYFLRDYRDKDGNNIFHLAGSDHMAEHLLAHAYQDAYKSVNRSGDRPLHIYARKGYANTLVNILKQLNTRRFYLGAGNIFSCNKDGNTIMHLALDNKNDDLAKFLARFETKARINSWLDTKLMQHIIEYSMYDFLKPLQDYISHEQIEQMLDLSLQMLEFDEDMVRFLALQEFTQDNQLDWKGLAQLPNFDKFISMSLDDTENNFLHHLVTKNDINSIQHIIDVLDPALITKTNQQKISPFILAKNDPDKAEIKKLFVARAATNIAEETECSPGFSWLSSLFERNSRSNQVVVPQLP